MKYLQYPSRRELAVSQNPLVVTNKFQNLSLPPFISYLLELSLGKPTKRGKKPQNKSENQMGSSIYVLQGKQMSKRVHVNQLGTNLYARPYIIVTYNGLEFENTRHKWDTSDCRVVWEDQEKELFFQNLCSIAEYQS